MSRLALLLGLLVLATHGDTAENTSTADVILVGDSTVQDWPLAEAKRGWGQLLPGFFAEGLRVQNHAAGGRSSKTFRSEGRWAKVLATHPKLVLIQFGHNDAHGAGRPESTDATTDFRENMARYVDEAKAAGISVVLVTPPPHRVAGPQGGTDGALVPYANTTKAVAKEKGVPCVDLFATATSAFNALTEQDRIALFCSVEDRSHFSPPGALLLARMIANALAQDPAIKGMLRPVAQWPGIPVGEKK
ncbi:MAG TPA: rhamnogalacturonan acetylesterase [Planctomycetota bacterium]|nr:rhamnogalacturonan acetylesterase [Planctomycetota bacterium]